MLGMTNNINGRDYNPEAVPASMVFLEMIIDHPDFVILEDFHPGVKDSVTLVHLPSNSALTLLVFETSTATQPSANDPNTFMIEVGPDPDKGIDNG